MTSRVLFVPVHARSSLEMIPVASKVAADGKYQPLFSLYYEHDRDKKDEYTNLLHQLGLLVIDSKCLADHTSSGWYQPRTGKQPLVSLKKYVHWALPAPFQRIINVVTDYTREIREADALLKRESVAALVLNGDRHVGWETALIKAANQRGIPSLVVPFAVSSPEIAARLRLQRQDVDRLYGMQALSNRISGMFFPNWVYESEGKRLLFLPGVHSVVAWALGIMPENPWTVGGGTATRMAVESLRIRRMFVEQGVPEEKLIVTGKPSVDQVYEAMQTVNRRIIRQELGIPEAGHVLLCSVPQLAEQGLLSWPQHWQEIEFLFATFAQLKNVSVVLSLNPQSNPADYKPLADRYGATLAKRRIYELLPICDVFVATYSSTVMQAIGIGKPTVVVDFYGLDYTFYDDAPGVIVLRSRDQLESTLTRLFSDPPYYNLLAETQRQQASEWILLDGKCTERVVEELYVLIEHSCDEHFIEPNRNGQLVAMER